MEKTIELFHEIRVSGKWESAQNAEIKANNQSLTIMSVCTFEKFAARLSFPTASCLRRPRPFAPSALGRIFERVLQPNRYAHEREYLVSRNYFHSRRDPPWKALSFQVDRTIAPYWPLMENPFLCFNYDKMEPSYVTQDSAFVNNKKAIYSNIIKLSLFLLDSPRGTNLCNSAQYRKKMLLRTCLASFAHRRECFFCMQLCA